MAKKNKFKRNKSDISSNIFDGGGIITDMYTLNISGPKLSQSGLPSSYLTGMKYGNMGNTSNVGSNLMSGLGNTALGIGAGIAGNLGGNLIAGGKLSGIGSTIGSLGNTIGGALMTVNPLVGGAIMGGTSLLGGAFNAAFGSKMNEERIALAENEINAANSFNANASNFDDLSLLIANSPIIAGFNLKDIGSDGWFSNKAKNKYKSLLALKKFAENWVDRSIVNAATNLLQLLMNNLLLNYAAYGGLLDMNNQYSDGGKIYIKPENRGKFTALKERTGKSATWFKEHGTPALKKMATFELNARKWKHEDGGDLNGNNSNDSNNSLSNKTQGFLDNIGYGDTPLSAIVPEEYKNIADGIWGGLEMFTPLGTIMGAADVANDIRNIYHKGNISSSDLGNLMLDSSGFIPRGKVLKKAAKSLSKVNKKSFGGDLLTNGTVFSNNVIEVNNGGTHEENPMEGILMGVDSNGIPNLVEEGETIWNDYVFSNRIPVPNAVRNKYKLRGTKDMTFSDAAKKILKASEERPNDPIANDTLNINLTRLANEQEVMRELKRKGNKYKKGGKLNSFLDAYNDWVTNPYNTATTGFGEGLDISPNLAASREKAIKNTIDYNKETDDLIARDNLLRYAPAFGNALGVGYGLLSKPNYSRADALALFAQNAGKITPISYNPLDNYLTYKPTDMNYIANRMAALAGATRRNIMNTSGGNRANAIGSLLAADYNSQIALADAIRLGEDTNWNRLMQTETFNRGTKLYNSEAALKAAMANQEARMKASQLGLSGYTNAMLMKDAIDALRAKTLSANLTNLFESLGLIGEEQLDRNRLKWLERKGVLRSDYFDTDKYSKNNKKTKR